MAVFVCCIGAVCLRLVGWVLLVVWFLGLCFRLWFVVDLLCLIVVACVLGLLLIAG